MGSVAHIGVEAGISADRAIHFYDSVIEPYRKAKGITASKAWSAYHTWKRREEEAEIDLDDLEADADTYGWDAVGSP